MKKIISILIILIVIFILYKGFNIVKKELADYKPITRSINEVKQAEEFSLRQSVNNFISVLEYDLEMKYLYGEISEYPLVYTNNNLSIKGQKPIKVNLNLKENIVQSGTLEYEKFVVKIDNKKIISIEKK